MYRAMRRASRGRGTLPVFARTHSVSIGLIKELREQSHAPIADCKKALQASAGDIQAAHSWLREKGVVTASKLSDRDCSSGLIGIAFNNSKTSASIVEVNSETDFVARTDAFQSLVSNVCSAALSSSDHSHTIEIAQLGTSRTPSGTTVDDAIHDAVASIRENLRVRRACRISAGENGVVCGYVHQCESPELGVGSKAAIVSLDVSENTQPEGEDLSRIEELGKKLAIHIVACRPLYVSQSDIPPSVLDHEKCVLREKALAAGKPEKVVDKMVDGQLKKLLEEVVLLDQKNIHDVDGKETISKALKREGSAIGCDVSVSDFAAFAVGEDLSERTLSS